MIGSPCSSAASLGRLANQACSSASLRYPVPRYSPFASPVMISSLTRRPPAQGPLRHGTPGSPRSRTGYEPFPCASKQGILCCLAANLNRRSGKFRLDQGIPLSSAFLARPIPILLNVAGEGKENFVLGESGRARGRDPRRRAKRPGWRAWLHELGERPWPGDPTVRIHLPPAQSLVRTFPSGSDRRNPC